MKLTIDQDFVGVLLTSSFYGELRDFNQQWVIKTGGCRPVELARLGASKLGVLKMARVEFHSTELSGIGQDATGEVFYQLGLSHSIGSEGEPDMIAAHKWFNLSAMKGNRDAAIRRQELADEMSSGEVAKALREAREFMRLH